MYSAPEEKLFRNCIACNTDAGGGDPRGGWWRELGGFRSQSSQDGWLC